MKISKKLFRRRRNRASAHQVPDPRELLSRQLPDALPRELDTILHVQPYTMTSPERILALTRATEHITRCNIPGAFVECGVWKGGSAAAACRELVRCHEIDRQIWLYDTFDGMSEPTDDDVDCWGQDAKNLLAVEDPNDEKSIWCKSNLNTVENVVEQTGYPMEQVRCVVGKVEETLIDQFPEQIALLRLDTDWYESTKCELEVLFPRLQPGGVLIIDDYGHWEGCRKAVDEYISDNDLNLFLHRIDYTGRMAIKPYLASAANRTLNSTALDVLPSTSLSSDAEHAT